MKDRDLRSIGRLLADYQLTPDELAQIIGVIDAEPSLILNDVPYYDPQTVAMIAAAIRRRPNGKRSRGHISSGLLMS